MGDGESEHLDDAVHGYLWRRAGTGAADELLGDLFCIAFERRAHFQVERASARPWLYGIATNQLQHWWRSRARADAAFRRVALREPTVYELGTRRRARARRPRRAVRSRVA